MPYVVSVAASDATATERNLTTGRYTFTRTGNTSNALAVNYRVGGTAVSGSDYVSLGTRVVFPPGAKAVTKHVTPIQDTFQESDETVELTVLQGANYAVGTSTPAVVMLTSDETITSTVNISAPNGVAQESDLSPGLFKFTRTGDTGAPLAIVFTVGGTASPGLDYSALGTLVTIPSGAESVTLEATVLQDALQELDETITIALSSGANYATGPVARATVTLKSDEIITQTVNIAAANITATEVNRTTGTLTFTRSGDISAQLTVKFGVTGTAAQGSDYKKLGTAITFPAGVTSLRKTVTPIQDALQESTETVIVSLRESAQYAAGMQRSATVKLTSDDPITATVTVAATDATATETGRTTGAFTFTRTGSTTDALTVPFVVSGSAATGTDYNMLGTSVTIPAGASRATKVLTPVQDSLPEPTETATITLSQSSKYLAKGLSATISIDSDE